MNFLLRTSQATASEQTVRSSSAESPEDSSSQSKPVSDENPSSSNADEGRTSRADDETERLGDKISDDHTSPPNWHVDVHEEEGWITVPRKELPDDWSDIKDIHSIRFLDRSFVFPGEQVQILACLSAKQDAEIITPFKVAAAMSKSVAGQNAKRQSGHAVEKDKDSCVSGQVKVDGQSDAKDATDEKDAPTNVLAGESLIRRENRRRRTQTLLHKFQESHFFVRIAESDELLWSKRGTSHTSEAIIASYDAYGGKNDHSAASSTSINAFIDKGRFDTRVSGGLARNYVKCFSLPSGDIVVLLQVNVGVDFLRDPTLEILQFEKHKSGSSSSESGHTSSIGDHALIGNNIKTDHDPCGELLEWLLPLDNSVPAPAHPLHPPPLANASHKSSFSASSGSQLFSFGHFRSYSISSNRPNPATSSSSQSSTSKPSSESKYWDRFASQMHLRSQKTGGERLLSFRGVPLEPDRFSACCGLEGIYIPGKRWRKRLEIVQPIDIYTFDADCNTDDLLCVQIKNVCPAHIPDIIVYIDAVSIIFEEASKDGSPSLIPVTCIEAGAGHSLPNLALRRGEEHSFILKPDTSILKCPKQPGNRIFQLPRARWGNLAASMQLSSESAEEKMSTTSEHYAVLVSCRCNYTESRLFFKKSTNWKPHFSRDLMISVASEVSHQSFESDGRVSQLPVQGVTLQASNLTLEDLTLTILAPASIAASCSVVTLNSNPPTPASPFAGFNTTQRLGSLPLLADHHEADQSGFQSLSLDDDNNVPISDVIPPTATACNHLWLQSRVPLGCVPSQSTATVKLELLPLTDGIITLDSLQISVKEKGVAYVPEHSLKINATSSIATGIS